jgi:NAD(P)-dependent dehydrogenase (short-subunit alcohol dehydrogenase family)
MDIGLTDACVVVQGGTEGMGRAAAQCFAQDGAKIAILARTKSKLDATVAQLRDAGAHDALALQADITKPDEITAAFEKVRERWGELNILVNSTGPMSLGNFDELTDADWFAAFDQGTMGMVRCVRAALPLMRAAKWGRIVNISAHSTKRQSQGLVAYTAAKAAVTSVTKNLSLHLAKDGILVNTVSPGSFATEAFRVWMTAQGKDPNDLYACMAAIKENYDHPAHLPRAGDPNEIGPVIAFAASPRNTYMTGANINVDGGSDFC